MATLSPSHNTSIRFHAPRGCSISCGPRNPFSSRQGFRPGRSNRAIAGPFVTPSMVKYAPLTTKISPVPPSIICASIDLDNYVNLPPQTDCAHDPNGNLEHASPEWLVTNGATTNPPPVMLYATQGDPVPYPQSIDMQNALNIQFPALEVNRYLMNYAYGDQHDHSYKYWHAQNNDPNSDGECVSQEVISFLQSHL